MLNSVGPTKSASNIESSDSTLLGAKSKTWFLILMVFLLIGSDILFLASRGIVIAPDSETYYRMAQDLIACGWDIPCFIRSTDPIFTPIVRISYTFLTALSVQVFGDKWAIGLVVVNLFFSTLAYILFARLLSKLKATGMQILFASVLMLLAFDYRMWVAYPLTEIPFAACAFGVLFLVFSIFTYPEKKIRRISLALLLGFFAITLRPTGPPLIAALLAFGIWRSVFRFVGPKHSERTFIGGFLILVILVCLVMTVAGCYFYSIATSTDLRRELEFLRDYYAQGVVIHGRPETFMTPPTNVVEYVQLVFVRFAAFFRFTAEGFSIMHNLVSSLFFVPVYSMALIAICGSKGLWARDRFRANVVLGCSTVVVAFAGFHAITLIDYDWRYRSPVLLPLVCLAVCGFDTVLSRIAELRRS